VKSAIEEFDKDISVRGAWIQGTKAESRRLLCECMQFDTDFQEEFNRIMDDLSVPEADKDFTRDFFDDTDLTTELAIPRDASGPEYARAATRLRDKMGCRDALWFTDGAAFR
jgi:hypothetical protein